MALRLPDWITRRILAPSPMPRVVQVIAPAPFGGAESVVRLLAEELPHAGCEVLVAALVGQQQAHPWVSQLREHGIRVEPVGSDGGGLLSEPRRLRDLCATFGADIVHSHGYRADIVAMLAARGRLPWVSTVHGFTNISARVRVYWHLDRLSLRSSQLVIAVADRVRDELVASGISPARVQVVRNAPRPGTPLGRAEARRELGLVTDGLAVGWVGRFSAEKGPDILVDVVRRLHAPCTLVLVGDGPLREQTLQALGTLDDTVGVRWVGVRENVGRLMPAFDLLILPSRTEAMPMVVLEAMSAGVPVAGFDVGDVRHAVNESTGWLVARGDVDGLAHATNEALADPTLRATKGGAAAALTATSFAASRWAVTHGEGYRTATERFNAPR